MTQTSRPATGYTDPQQQDNAPPTRSKVAGMLAAVACAVSCAVPLLIAAGLLTGAGAAIMQKTLLAVAFGLVAAGLSRWWLHRRRHAATSTTGNAVGDHGC